jgi:hypothetical protein
MGSHPKRNDERRSGRERRLAEALRANLKRRKAQQRDRSVASGQDAGGGRDESAKEPG